MRSGRQPAEKRAWGTRRLQNRCDNKETVGEG